LWSADAVVTVNHAVRTDRVQVTLTAGKTVSAQVAGRDASTDVAVLRLEDPLDGTPAKWTETSGLRVGELVLALARTWRGNVVGSSGIIGGLMNTFRTWRGGELDQFIRPDLNFYPGFSGGPLVGPTGVLGINTAGLHRSPITIPSSTVSRVVTELLEKGTIQRPYLGVAMNAVTLQESLRRKLNLTSSEGLLIVHVEPDGPADRAGVLVGDMLLELNDQPVASTDDVQEVLQSAKAGGTISAHVVRGGTMQKLQITPSVRTR
jgi:S1-C subfamily serine protease